jgi:uncharacterized protein YfeS
MFRNTLFSLAILTCMWGCRDSKNTNSKDKSQSTNSNTDTVLLTVENAHPNAKALLTEDFYWSPIEETAPFGSDDGSDSFYGFKDWRRSNKSSSPLIYLRDLIDGWGYKHFDWKEMDTMKIQKYISSDPIGSSMLIGQDNAIIAVGFGQFALEGKIDQDIQELTGIAIKRELEPILIREFRPDYHGTRKEQLNKMFVVLGKMNQSQ